MMQDHIEGIGMTLVVNTLILIQKRKSHLKTNVTDDNKITHLIFKKGNTLMSSAKSFLKMD